MAGFNETGDIQSGTTQTGFTAPAGEGELGQMGHSRDLIESDRVEGTAVYNRQGDRLGTVRRFLVEKRSGQALYAEMAFGGFLGIGEDTHPLPWEVLDYDVEKGGYVVDLTEDQLRSAPRYGQERRAMDDVYDAEIRSYYGLMPPI